MVKGNFQCIGSPQHIKNKYGEGLEVEVKLKNPQRSDIMQVMAQRKLEARIVK